MKWKISGYPRHRENRENGPKKIPCQGKHKEFGNFVKTQGILSKHWENTGNCVKTQRFFLSQVVNALILKVKDIAIFFQKLDRSAKSVLCM